MSTAADRVLEKITAWAAGDARIRRLVLVGSRASAAHDDLADIDVQIYTGSAASLLGDETWLRAIGDVAVRVRNEYVDGGVHVPTRLVIFSDGVKVDFAFYPVGPLSTVTAGLPHRILMEKDALQHAPPAKSGAPDPGPPLAAEFRRIVEEFWFEAYHVAKYLARGELWLAKERDWATKQFLVKMIEWHERAVHGRHHHPHAAGMRASVSDDTWDALHRSFAGAGSGESRAAALETARLFRRLAVETATALRYEYPAGVDEGICRIIAAIEPSAGAPPR